MIWFAARMRELRPSDIPDAPHPSLKGLRHGFGVHATVQGVPLHMLQRHLGYALGSPRLGSKPLKMWRFCRALR